MRTRELFRYLVAMIIALSTTVNAMAQERNLKIYFNEYVEGATGAPIMLVKDDNDSYGLPAGLTYSSEGMAWAKEARFFEWVNQDVKDRLIADYVTKNGTVDKKNSHLKISFEDFPYEVNGIQWNVMNDLLSGSITEFFKNYNVTTKCTPVSGSGFSYTEEHWAMNIFQHSTSFNKGSIPWQNGAILKGLKSFELSEKYFVELGLGNWTLWNFGQSDLSAKCRTFFKAGWNGQEGSNSNITDSDDNNWAFKITFTMPEIRVRNGRDLFVGDVNQIEGYISAHQGAVEVTSNPSDLDRFHFEYFSSNDNVATINQYTGVIRAINAGNVDITVKLMRGDRDVCSCNYPLTVLNNSNPNIGTSTAEICVVFDNGNKGYDLTVGDTNGKIQGNLVSVFGGSGSINVTGNHNGYHYEYTSANTEIAEIDQYTGVITPKKEGDVDISAVLKNGNTVVSNTYTYTLHVFAPNEGLDWNRVKTYNYSYNTTQQNTNKDLWIIKNYQTTLNPSHDWSPITLLKTDTYIKQNLDGSDNNSWKQIAAFTTPSVEYYRAICQKIKIDVRVPKYSKATATYKFAGNVTLVDQGNNNYTRYGLEIKDLGVVSSEEADNEINSIKLNTYNSGKNGMVSDPATLTTIVRAGAQNGYNAFMGASSEIPSWETDNRDGAAPTSETRYLAAMAYIHFNNSYSATTSIGYKGIPTYTYYSHIYYYKNINDGEGSYKNEEVYSEGKTGTMQLNRNFSAPTRNGYTFLGWSTNPEATVAEYEYRGEFCSYDDVNGGGKGPVYLYAVWRPNTYTVTLDHNDGTGVTERVNVIYNEYMPSVGASGEPLVAPVRDGYTFQGYYYTEQNGTENRYYESDMTSTRKWIKTNNETVLYAKWEAKTYTVELRHTSTGPVDGYVDAVYGQNMPLVDVDGNSVEIPKETGYDFNGYYAERYGGGNKYYNLDMSSNHVWDRTDKNYVIAQWMPHKIKVVFDPQGGNNYGATYVTATYGQAMPTEGVQAPQRQGYTFGGYYSKQNGAGTQYYTIDMTSARTWNIDEPEVTLYAKWIPIQYAVTLDKQGGTGGSSSVTASYGQPLPSGLTAPTKEGYEFKGYYSNQNQEYKESMGQDYGGTQYYDKDMVSVESWNSANSGTIYAHWAPATFIVTFNGTNGAIVPKQLQYDSQSAISDVIYNSDGVVKISFKYGGQCPSQITNGKFKKAGFKLVGFYDSNNVLVATVDVDKPTDRNIYFNESSGYWTRKDGNLVWNCTHDVNLTARYEPKYTVRDGDIIDFGTEYLEVGIDWENSMVHDLLGAALAEKEAGRISSTNPVMVFDIRNAKYLDNSSKKSDDLMVPLRDKDFISPNLLVYLGEGAYNVIENEIKTDGTCPGLVVTDRFPIKIPYAFKAGKALYERNKVQKDNNDLDDAMWKQSHESIWGTLCLPYPIKNNNTYNDVSKVIFYELRKKSGSVMQFKKLPENAEIPANTPVLYERTVGIGSAVTIEENAENIYNKNTWISVPKNQSYEAEVTSYANATEPSIRDWEFRGNLKTNVFCGKGYINPPAAAIANSDITNNGEVYYFKQNKFTRLTPSMEKNGVHYDAGMMTIYPYRAYFFKKGTGGSAKIASYSILVVDEFGNTTDITNAVFGDGEGDGKIYDLNGIRVMQPVKGRLYIVNGQKKVYR